MFSFLSDTRISGSFQEYYKFISSSFGYTEHTHRRFESHFRRDYFATPHRNRTPWQRYVPKVGDSQHEYVLFDRLSPEVYHRNESEEKTQYTLTSMFHKDVSVLLVDATDGDVDNVSVGNVDVGDFFVT